MRDLPNQKPAVHFLPSLAHPPASSLRWLLSSWYSCMFHRGRNMLMDGVKQWVCGVMDGPSNFSFTCSLAPFFKKWVQLIIYLPTLETHRKRQNEWNDRVQRGVKLAERAPRHLSPTAQTVQTGRCCNRVATRENEMDKSTNRIWWPRQSWTLTHERR